LLDFIALEQNPRVEKEHAQPTLRCAHHSCCHSSILILQPVSVWGSFGSCKKIKYLHWLFHSLL